MKLGIDIRPLQGETRYRGIGKSLEFFLDSFAVNLPADIEPVFYIDKTLQAPEALSMFPQASCIKVDGSPLGRMRYVRSVLPSYPLLKVRKRDVDVVLQYDAALGIPKNVPTITIFHDLIPYLFRDQERRLPAQGMRKVKNSLARNLYWQKYLRVLKSYPRSKHVVAISTASKKDLLNYATVIQPSQVSVVPHGVRPFIVSGKPTKKVISLTAEQYLLYVGGIDFRKNVTGLLKTFFELKSTYPKLKLITVGKEFGLDDQLEDLGWNEQLRLHPREARDVVSPGFLSETDLHYLYANAAAFVFPSRYEGFGMPLLEAMQAGCPVIAYKNSSIPEVAGDAALLIEDGEDLKEAVGSLLDSNSMRQQYIKKGLSQVKKFTWDNTVSQILEICRKNV